MQTTHDNTKQKRYSFNPASNLLDHFNELIKNGVPESSAKLLIEAYQMLKRGDPEELLPFVERNPNAKKTIDGLDCAIGSLMKCELYNFELDDFPEFIKKTAEGKISLKDRRVR